MQTIKIKELIKTVASLVESRAIIDHGSIRCLYSEKTASEIESAEGCEADTGTIGDDDLAAELADLAENGDRIADLWLGDLVELERSYLGDSVNDYIDDEKEDSLGALGELIEAARELCNTTV
jgi:hypothetical protein